MDAILTSRAWNNDLAEALHDRLGIDFDLITSKEDFTPAYLRAHTIERVFIPHWSHIIPAEIYEHFECIVFHMTDLPYGRGGSPLQNLIARGHEDTQITAIRVEAGLDTGAVYLKRPLSLAGSAQEIFLRARGVIEEMIIEIIKTAPTPQPQTGEAVTFKRRTPAQSALDTTASPRAMYDHIRMLDAPGYPHAYIEHGEQRIEFCNARLEDGVLKADVQIKNKHDT